MYAINHTNSYAHKYYIDIISIPIHLDWVTISSFKNIEIGKYKYKM